MTEKLHNLISALQEINPKETHWLQVEKDTFSELLKIANHAKLGGVEYPHNVEFGGFVNGKYEESSDGLWIGMSGTRLYITKPFEPTLNVVK